MDGAGLSWGRSRAPPSCLPQQQGFGTRRWSRQAELPALVGWHWGSAIEGAVPGGAITGSAAAGGSLLGVSLLVLGSAQLAPPAPVTQC